MAKIKRVLNRARKDNASSMALEALNLNQLPLEVCSLGQLTELSLSQNLLSALPAQFVHLRSLRMLDLSHNRFTELPGVVCRLPELRSLHLHTNFIQILPDEIGELSKLEELYLTHNAVMELPESIGGLSQLKRLDLSHNQLRTLPHSIGDLGSLKEFWLNDNPELESLPDEIGFLRELEKFYVYTNKLTSLPETAGKLTSLRELFVYNAQLAELPCLQNLRQLVSLYVFHNRLSVLPDWIGNLKGLQKLSATHNFISVVPPSIGNLENLSVLHLQNNQISRLPPEIGKLKALIKLDVAHNQLVSVPSSIGECGFLARLYLYTNHLTTLPPEIGRLTNLTKLSVYNNPLTSPPTTVVVQGTPAILAYLKAILEESSELVIENGDDGKSSGKHGQWPWNPPPSRPIRSESFSDDPTPSGEPEQPLQRVRSVSFVGETQFMRPLTQSSTVAELFSQIAQDVRTPEATFRPFVRTLKEHYYYMTEDLLENSDWISLLPAHLSSRVRRVLNQTATAAQTPSFGDRGPPRIMRVPSDLSLSPNAPGGPGSFRPRSRSIHEGRLEDRTTDPSLGMMLSTSLDAPILADDSISSPRPKGVGTEDRKLVIEPPPPIEAEERQSPFQKARERFRDFIIGREHISFIRLVGKGAYGEVHLGKYMGSPVAIKKLIGIEFDETHELEFLREMEMLITLRHPNVILFLGIVLDPPPFCIVTEFAESGSLYDLLHVRKETLAREQIHSILLQTARGMNYLHTRPHTIIHRDLKSANILLTKSMDVKIGDFGRSKMKRTRTDVTSTVSTVGTPLWMAPEVMGARTREEGRSRYGVKCDVYSFAIVMWECFEQRLPFGGLDFVQVIFQVANQQRPPISDLVPLEYATLIQRCWAHDAKERPSFAEILDYLEEVN